MILPSKSKKFKDKNPMKGNVAWSFIENLSRQLISLLIFLISARFVSIEEFGVMAISLLIVEAFKQIFIDSFGVALTSMNRPSDKDYNACFLITLLTSICSALIVFFSADLIGKAFKNTDIGYALELTSILLALLGLSKTHEVWLAKKLKFKTLALRSIASIIIGGIVGVYLAINGYGLLALICQQLVTIIISTIFLWIGTPWKPYLDTSKAHILSLLKFSKHLIATSCVGFASSQSDVFFSSLYLGDISTGIYNSGKRITTALNAILTVSLNKVMFPFLSNIDNVRDELPVSYLKATKYTSLVSAPIHIGIAFLSQDLIVILLGDKWLAASPILSVLVISNYISSIAQYNHIIMLIKNKPNWEFKLMLSSAIVNVILLAIFTKFGLLALALAFTARSVLFYPISAVLASSLLKIPNIEHVKAIFPSIIASGVMFLALAAFNNFLSEENNLIRLSMFTILGIIIYCITYVIIDKKTLIELKKDFLN